MPFSENHYKQIFSKLKFQFDNYTSCGHRPKDYFYTPTRQKGWVSVYEDVKPNI